MATIGRKMGVECRRREKMKKKTLTVSSALAAVVEAELLSVHVASLLACQSSADASCQRMWMVMDVRQGDPCHLRRPV